MSEKKDNKIELELPELEAPPAGDSPAGGAVDALFGAESLAHVMAKSAVLESMLITLTRNHKFADFMREILLAVMRVVKSEAGSILEVNQSNNTLFFRAVAGRSSDKIADFVIPMGQGIVGHVAESRLPLVVDNAAEHEKHLKSVGQAVGFEAKNMVALPIVIRGRIYGVLELLNRVGDKTYTAADVELLTYLCTMMAKAIEIRLMLAYTKRGAAEGSDAA